MSTSVQTPEASYSTMEAKWRTCRDVIAGKDEVFTRKETYLPLLSEQSDSEYLAYQKRAGWFGAASRTKDALKGMIFRKELTLEESSTAMAEFFEDVNMKGDSIFTFANELVDEVLETGRAGILVDYQRESVEGLSRAEAEELNFRPYIQLYKAENIIGYREEKVQNKKVITQIRVKEVSEKVKDGDEFDKETIEQIRVLELVEGVYQQRIFAQESKDGEFIEKDTVVIRRNGKTMNYIPFIFVGSQDLSPSYDKPPLYDLVEVNLDYYRTKADYKHGLHFTGLPTPIITGHRPDDDNTEFRIGSTKAWIFPEEGADAKYLEFTGQGLQELREELKELKSDMAILGARMLAGDKRAVEATETHLIKRAGEYSLLSAVANNSSEALNQAIGEIQQWNNITGDFSARLNTDFVPAEMGTQEIVQLWSVVQSGGMTFQDYLWNLHQGERLKPDMDDLERESALQTTPLPTPAPAPEP